DNVKRHGVEPVSWSRNFTGKASRATARRSPPSRRREAHEFRPNEAPERLGDLEGLPAGYESIWFKKGQTFGFELELTNSSYNRIAGHSWFRKAERLRVGIAEAHRARYGQSFVAPAVYSYGRGRHNVWNVESDSSAGWEVTSRILEGREGIEELIISCEAIKEIAKAEGLKVNARTGMHLHLGWTLELKAIKRLVALMHLFEPAFASIVAPSRSAAYDWMQKRYRPETSNPYCRPISSGINMKELFLCNSMDALKKILARVPRNLTLNLRSLKKYGTVEFRMHSGTTDFRKALLWLTLCQQLLHRASQGEESISLYRQLLSGGKRRVIQPNDQLLMLAERYLPDGSHPAFQALLKARREEIYSLIRHSASLTNWHQPLALSMSSPTRSVCSVDFTGSA
ncbi:MAG: amidoligase family protein, partial [Myxococcota bacterium]|nr:amidoligase family protein [Myxococcota bacterium]